MTHTSVTPSSQEFDKVIVDIVDYITQYPIISDLAYDTAYYCFLDTLGCGME
ncbi:2-methylcitrate dehydratase PrpD [Providencia alcalifaciens]|nr:2-methylcitrate dehydratase PrpD [Providencia alcalifaciens]